MYCPKCQSRDTQVLESRDCPEGLRRRRVCQACKQRFTTYERVETVNLLVIKKDGRKEKFNLEKVVRGVQTACKNRPVSEDQINALADLVEQQILTTARESVTSEEIGLKVQTALQPLDEVAYLRFISVYDSFSKASDFAQAISDLSNLNRKP